MQALREIVFLVVWFSVYVTGVKAISIFDLYWKPWKGNIPDDAVVGGQAISECGTEVPFYLAQAYFTGYDGGAFPGRIFSFSKSIKGSYGGKQLETDKLIQVLCAKDQHGIEWVPVAQLKKLNNLEGHCVVAGIEPHKDYGRSDYDGDYLYFTRAHYKNDRVIGKLNIKSKNSPEGPVSLQNNGETSEPKNNWVMNFPYAGKEKFLEDEFEVLCYRPKCGTPDFEIDE